MKTRHGLAVALGTTTLLAPFDRPTREASTITAAPWLILIEGTSPGTRSVFSDWETNNRLMRAIAHPTAVDAHALATRTSLRVALFWGPRWQNWRAYINPDTLSFQRANQHARLYLGTNAHRAIWVFEPGLSNPRDMVRDIDSTGIAIMKANGVPVTLRR